MARYVCLIKKTVAANMGNLSEKYNRAPNLFYSWVKPYFVTINVTF